MASSTNKPQSTRGLENLVVGVVRGIAGNFFEMPTFKSVTEIVQHANPGDLLEFHRGLFSHYALYLGQGKVMNIGAEDKNTTKALICEMKLEDVCRDSKVRVKNHDDIARKHFLASPKTVFEIIRAAKSFESKMVPYEFDFRNCEYYSTLWRYGRGFSTQAAKPTATPLGSVAFEVMTSLEQGKGLFGATETLRETEWYGKYKRLAHMNPR